MSVKFVIAELLCEHPYQQKFQLNHCFSKCGLWTMYIRTLRSLGRRGLLKMLFPRPSLDQVLVLGPRCKHSGRFSYALNLRAMQYNLFIELQYKKGLRERDG